MLDVRFAELLHHLYKINKLRTSLRYQFGLPSDRRRPRRIDAVFLARIPNRFFAAVILSSNGEDVFAARDFESDASNPELNFVPLHFLSSTPAGAASAATG